MGMISKIFEPIVTINDVPLDDINAVAFDTMETLVRDTYNPTTEKRFVLNKPIAELFQAVSAHKEKLGLDSVTIISGDTQFAQKALEVAGMDCKTPIELRSEFYSRMGREGKNVLVVDDDFFLAMEAQASVNPNDPNVREYLESVDYKNLFEPT
jgi:hypothetical protein